MRKLIESMSGQKFKWLVQDAIVDAVAKKHKVSKQDVNSLLTGFGKTNSSFESFVENLKKDIGKSAK